MADKDQDNPDKKGLRGAVNALFSRDSQEPGYLKVFKQELGHGLRDNRREVPLMVFMCALTGMLTAMAGGGTGALLYNTTEPSNDSAAIQTGQASDTYSVVAHGGRTLLLVKTGEDYHLFSRGGYDRDNKFEYVGQVNTAHGYVSNVLSGLTRGSGDLMSARDISVAVDEGEGGIYRYYQELMDEGRIEGKNASMRYAEVSAFWRDAESAIRERGYGYTAAQREALPDRADEDASIVNGAVIGALLPFTVLLGLWGTKAAGRTRFSIDYTRRKRRDSRY